MPAGGILDKERRPAVSRFKQQQLAAWQPILTPHSVIPCFFILGIIFVPIGAIILVASQTIQEQVIEYDNICGSNNVCSVNFTIQDSISTTVYFYYQLSGFYQNHRQYVKSRDDNQLQGNRINTVSELSDCSPLISVNGSNDIALAYFPCGLIANSQFNDTFILNQLAENGSFTFINWTKTGIAWQSDIDKKFGRPPTDQLGFDMPQNRDLFVDEDFIVWMRAAALPDFRKLYRYVNSLAAGTYYVNISNNYDVSSFGGRKSFVISTISWIGGKNDFLGYAYIVVGAACFLIGAIFLCKHWASPRKMADITYLNWNQPA